MSDKPAEKPRVLLRPLSGASNSRLASLRPTTEPDAAARTLRLTPKAQSGVLRDLISPAGSPITTPNDTPQPTPVLSTRQLLAQVKTNEPQEAARPKQKVIQFGSKSSSVPWKTLSPVKSEGLTATSFASVAHSSKTDDGIYRPQALPFRESEQKESVPASMFMRSDGTLREREFMIVQLPQILPTYADPATVPVDDARRSSSRRGSLNEPAKQGTQLSELPDGKLGTLRIYKSGRATFVIGGIEFDAEEGYKAAFRQEIGCLCPDDKEFAFLGEVTRKIILSPALDQVALTKDDTHVVHMDVD